MVFKENDFILIEYSVRVKETGNLIDTSNEEIAKKENIYDPDRVYGPTLIVIGKKWINPVVEEELKNMNVGEEKTIEVPPEKAFGHRDPDKVKVFRLSEFRKRGIDVRVGEVIDFGGVQGIVKSVGGGRVVVDFNHPLAGKTLVYTVKVVAKLENIVDKIRALATRHLSIKGEELGIVFNKDEREVLIDIPTKYMTKKNIQYGKLSLATDVLEFFKDEIDRIVYREVIARKKEEAKREEESVEKSGETGSGSGEKISQ